MTWFLWQSHGICMKAHRGRHDSCDRVPGYGWKSTADDTIPVTESDSGLAKSRARSYFRSLGSWEFGHGEPSHERATTKAQLGSLWNLLGSLGRLAEPIRVTYISCVSAKNSFNCMLSRHNQDCPLARLASLKSLARLGSSWPAREALRAGSALCQPCRIMRIWYNVDRNILIQYDYQLTHYDRRECLCVARNFFKPAGTLCPLASKRLYNLVAAGKPLACLAASILAARSIIRLCSVGSPIGETGSINCIW